MMDENIFTIGSEEGLPNLQIHTIAIDLYERLWLAGPSGLSCYNGNEIEVFDTRNGLLCSGLRTIEIQNNNIIWIGTDRGIEQMTLEGTIVQIQYNFDWKYGIAESFYFEKDLVWVGSSFGLIKLRFIDERLELVSALDLGLVSQILKHGDSLIVISSKRGLIEYKDEEIRSFSEYIPEETKVTYIVKTIDLRFLIGTTDGLYVTNAEGKISQHYKSPQASNKVNSIAIIQGKWVIGFINHIVIISEESFKIKELETIKIKSSIKKIIGDSFGNIWVATNNGGLKKISFLRNTIKKIECGNDEAVFSTQFSSDKKEIYIGGEGFFSILSKTEGQDLPKLLDYCPIDTIVWDTVVDPVNPRLIWFATQDGIYTKKRHENPVLDRKISDVISSPARVLLTRGKTIYVGTISGLYSIADGITKEVLTAKGDKFGYVYNLSLNDKNKIWAATLGQGLWMETEEGFVNLSDKNIISKGNTYSIITHPSGNSIVLQGENVILLDSNLNSTLIATEFPMCGWSFTWINENTIAVGTDNGLNIINLIERKIQKKINLYLAKSKWQATSSRSIVHFENEKLYYGQVSGLYFIDLKEIERLQTPPEVHLNHCNWTNANPELINDTYSLPFGKWTMDTSVYSTWYMDEHQINFRFKLVGFDEDWSKLGTSTTIHYNSLPLGKYELFVQGFTPLTGFAEPISLFKIKVTSSLRSFIHLTRGSIASFLKLKRSGKTRNRYLITQNELIIKELEERKRLETEFIDYKAQLEDLVLQRTNELKIEKEKAEESDRQKTIFLASMSHEIRTPLSGIIGLTDLLNDTTLDPIQEEYNNKIGNSSEHLHEIINNILDITKIESGQLELEKNPFSLLKLLDDIAEFAQIKIESKSIDFIIDESILTENLLIGDVLRIKQVIFNLIGNAIKFTDSGSILFKIKELKTNSEKVFLQFVVSDSGIGMNEAQLKKLFDPFTQAEKSTARKYGGTGLGLSISQKYIEMMGGTLTAKSQIENGTAFTFTLEFTKDAKTDPKKEVKILPDFQSRDILVIDDNLIESDVILRQLSNTGMVPKGVQTIEEAIQELNKKSYDLIIMDWHRPDLKGVESIKLLRKHLKKEVKIVILHSNNKAHLLVQLRPLKIDQVIIKPISQIKFQEEINKAFSVDITKKLTSSTRYKVSEERKKLNNSFKILVAEDDKTNQLVIRKTLEREGYQVTVVLNGKKCIEELKRNGDYDIVLMDIQMPEMNGIEATQYIRSELNLHTLPIIAFTADVTLDMRNKISDFGMDNYLSKPIDLQQLHALLDSLILNK